MAEKVTSKQYAKELENIKIKDLRFLEVSSKIFLENFAPEESRVGIKTSLKNKVEIKKSDDLKIFAGFDNYELEGTVSKKKIVEIKLKVMIIFESKKNVDEKFLQTFEKNSLKIFTYPYIRQIIQDLTTKMGLPPLILPIWTRPEKS